MSMLTRVEHEPYRYNGKLELEPFNHRPIDNHGIVEETKDSPDAPDAFPRTLRADISLSGTASPKQHIKYRSVRNLSIEAPTHRNQIVDSYFNLIFKHMLHKLLTASERRLYYIAILFTICYALLRASVFIFITAIIDLLAGTQHDYLQALCPKHTPSTLITIDCTNREHLIYVFLIILLILCITAPLFNFAQHLLASVISCAAMKRLNSAVFKHVVSENMAFFDEHEKRDLIELLSTDMSHLRTAMKKLLLLFEACMHFMCGLIYLFAVNWDIALIIVGSFIFLLIFSILYMDKSHANHKRRSGAFKVVQMSVNEMVNFITTIKTFSKEEDECFIHSEGVKRAYQFQSKKDQYLYSYLLAMRLIWYLSTLGIIWYGTHLIFWNGNNNAMTVGVLIMDLVIFMHINWNIYRFIVLSPTVINEGCESIARIVYVLEFDEHESEEKRLMDDILYDDRSSETDERDGGGGDETKQNEKQSKSGYIPKGDDLTGLIELKDIDFAYPAASIGRKKLVLQSVNLKFLPSSMTALVGLSGSGKSTVFKLIMRFYDFDSGQICIDGVDIKKYNLPFLHSRIGYVGQFVHLFQNRSIADNIRFGMKLDTKHHEVFDAEYFDEEHMYFWRQYKSITQVDVENAAKIANAHGFIMNLKYGYQTIIGGKAGIKLSAGERQRIAIARAVLLNPKILLLDEAMSNVDPISKHLILDSLDRIMMNRCVVVIAHRLKTVMRADCICVIHQGRVVQNGTHQELIKEADGIYAKFIEESRFN